MSLNTQIEVYLSEGMEWIEEKINAFAVCTGIEKAKVVFAESLFESDIPVCVPNNTGFDIHWKEKTSHIASAEPSLALAVALSLQNGFENEFVRVKRIRQLISRMLQSLVVTGEVEDRNGMSHSERVTRLVEKFAPRLGITGEELSNLLEYSMLHDVGKIEVEQIMLYTPTRIRTWLHTGQDHTIVGSIFLATTMVLGDAAPISRSHHERWDGKGYPDGLRGEEIPYYARVIGICDFYDEALNTVSSEIMGRPLDKEEAIEIIESENGKMFDPKITEEFLKMVREI